MIQFSCCSFQGSVYIFCHKSPKCSLCNGIEVVHYSGLNLKFLDTLISIQVLSTCLMIRVLLKALQNFPRFGSFRSFIWKTLFVEAGGLCHCIQDFLLLFPCRGLWWQAAPGLLSCVSTWHWLAWLHTGAVAGREMNVLLRAGIALVCHSAHNLLFSGPVL